MNSKNTGHVLAKIYQNASGYFPFPHFSGAGIRLLSSPAAGPLPFSPAVKGKGNC